MENTGGKRQRPTAHGLGITTEKPKFRHYAQLNKRYESFSELDWPENSPVSVKDLVEAGLVYTGVGDSVRCFYCGGGIRNWEEGDRPIVEHARWYPNCPYVILLKGRRFVQQISDGEIPTERLDEGQYLAKCESKAEELRSQDLLQCPAAQALIQMGYTEVNVERAIREHQRLKGDGSFTAKDLCTILLDIEDNPDKYTVLQTEESGAPTSTGACFQGNTDDFELEDLDDLEKENERLKEQQTCKVCLEHIADIIFLPCGHIACCGFCAPALEKCLICRKDINGQIKAIYASTKNSYAAG